MLDFTGDQTRGHGGQALRSDAVVTSQVHGEVPVLWFSGKSLLPNHIVDRHSFTLCIKFRNTHRQERSNILKSIKEVAGILFMGFKLDPMLVSSQQASKATEASLLSLLKCNGVGDYIRLAPTLFENPDSMDADGFMKNPILIKVCRP